MKIRHPLMIRSVAMVVSWAVRIWLSTLSQRIIQDEGSSAPRLMGRNGVYLFWHEVLLLPTAYVGGGFSALISKHADGELIAQIIEMLGGHSVRGSTSKSGMTALRCLIKTGKVRHLAITPDGPRGPRREIKPGAVYLASRSGLPIVPVGFGVRECWRVRSWDRMVVPKPGTVAVAIVGRPLEVPPNLDRDGIELYRLRAQAALDDVQHRAELAVVRKRRPVAGNGMIQPAVVV